MPAACSARSPGWAAHQRSDPGQRPAHAIPVQINRNGLRTIAVGTGDTCRFKLPYLPTSADVVAGDLLVTSGLGGGFPAGYPVGTVTTVKRDPAQSLAEVDVRPAAALDRSRELMLVWLKPSAVLPTAPTATTPASAQPAAQQQPEPPPRRQAHRGQTASRLLPPRRRPPSSPRQPPTAKPTGRANAMMRDDPIRRVPMALSSLGALALAVHPVACGTRCVPPGLSGAGGFYWSIESPRAGGLTLAFVSGLALDVINGVVLGQHALALTLMAAWATHLRLRLRVFSLLSQCLTIFALLTGYQFVLFWIDGATGNPVTSFGRWFAPVVGAVIWPFLAGALGRLNER